MTFNDIYEENKKLDRVFDIKYNMHNDEIIQKNKVELVMELSELMNETRCFKYWSNKKINMDALKEEYADTIIMILTFYNLLNLELDNLNFQISSDSVMDLFMQTYSLMNDFYYHTDDDTIKCIMEHVLEIGLKLGLTMDEIIKAVYDKIMINYQRMEMDY